MNAGQSSSSCSSAGYMTFVTSKVYSQDMPKYIVYSHELCAIKPIMGPTCMTYMCIYIYECVYIYILHLCILESHTMLGNVYRGCIRCSLGCPKTNDMDGDGQPQMTHACFVPADPRFKSQDWKGRMWAVGHGDLLSFVSILFHAGTSFQQVLDFNLFVLFLGWQSILHQLAQ